MYGNHPKKDVTPNSVDRLILKIGWFIIVIHFVLVLSFYFNLPDTIPIHFNAMGKADGFGGKSNIWTIPVINLIIYYGMNFLIKKVKPWQMNYPLKVTTANASKLYQLSFKLLSILSISCVLLFFIVSLETILIAGKYVDSGLGFTLPIFITFITLLPFYFIFKMFQIPKS